MLDDYIESLGFKQKDKLILKLPEYMLCCSFTISLMRQFQDLVENDFKEFNDKIVEKHKCKPYCYERSSYVGSVGSYLCYWIKDELDCLSN